jgi:hypothetical protein
LVLKLISPQIHLLIPEIYNDFFLVHFYQFAKINGFIRLCCNQSENFYLLAKKADNCLSLSAELFSAALVLKPLSLITLSVNSDLYLDNCFTFSSYRIAINYKIDGVIFN